MSTRPRKLKHRLTELAEKAATGIGFVLLTAACETHFADPVVGSGSEENPCAEWSTPQSCAADADHGCSSQPNPVGCDPARCAAATCLDGDPFVRRAGRTLWLQDRPYRFIGVNAWGIAYSNECRFSGFGSQDEALARAFHDLASMRVSVLRFWAFQSFAGESGTDYSAFDRIVSYAKRSGVRLIFVLENMHADCSRGGQRNDDWFRSGYASPYGGYTLSMPDYVAGLVQHFRDEPDVLAWELIHEASGTDFSAMDGFVTQMSSLIRTNDPNHLIIAGMNNGDSPATRADGNASNYAELHAHATIDMLDVHDFDVPGTPFTSNESAAQAIGVALNKPTFVGAIGITLREGSSEALLQRSNQIASKLDAAFANDVTGALVYDYNPDWATPGLSFDARSSDPLGGPNGVIATRSKALLAN